MSSFPKTARHPIISSLIEKWGVVGESIDVEGDFRLSEFPQLAGSAGRVQNAEDLEYFGGAREIVGANAIRTLAKCYEALDASGACGEAGINMGALVQAYTASFLAARGFCMLMGFAPLDRASLITLDAFFEEIQRTKRIVRSTDVLRLHRYRRWGHEEVWSLTTRLVDTMEVPSSLKAVKEQLRAVEIGQSARVRNAFQYDDSVLALSEVRPFADFPDRFQTNLFDVSAPDEVRENYSIARSLLELCSLIVEESKIANLLVLCMSEHRVDSALAWGRWA